MGRAMTGRLARLILGFLLLGNLVGCAHGEQPPPGLAPLVPRVVHAVRDGGIDLSTEQAACLVRMVSGEPGAVAEVRRHPDLRSLSGPSGAAVAQAFEWCVGATFADSFGYEPEPGRAS